ncbi:MAG: hypothetical protein K6F83_03145 [Clostridiales bacterium]|nr:hypothetical protein [Clostridiales bacterium]
MTKYLLIGLLIFAVVFTIIGRIRYNSKSTQERLKTKEKEKDEWFKRLSGRTEGRIIEHHWEDHGISTGPHKNSEEDMDVTDTVFMVTYEFEVNGQTYTGNGAGSPSFGERESQMICYDPSDPEDNCTMYFYKSESIKRSNIKKPIL